ncbi:hypothetical protein OSB04_022575 [Centaurea solstitialis]|uniref:Uncharacterized protein n=1 Tax=Centaurea solstitialis TaxID=347529 RepID=A0AA38TES4_9ASTR|nr:hypothetical protein OSB04_022575 [Centaurea solstitialis]
MLWIGIYIAVASLFCILLMVADLFHGFRSRELWFPSKYFTLNVASITVITITTKLTVDLSSRMPGLVDQMAKAGSMTFMCTMMANLMPSLASMDNRELFANVAGMVILIVTMVINIVIQIETGVIDWTITLCYINIGAMLSLLVLVISSALTIPTSKRILELKYQAVHKTTSNDLHLDHTRISTVEELAQHVIVVSCKIIGLIPLGTVIIGVLCLYCWKSLKSTFFAMHVASNRETIHVHEQNDTKEDIENCTLQLQDDMELGISYILLVEESLNNMGEYVKIRKSTMGLWREVEVSYRWLGNMPQRNAFRDKTPKDILEWFSDKAKKIVVEMSKDNNEEKLDDSHDKLIVADSMYRVIQTIKVKYANDIEQNGEDELFGLLSSMIADILVACFTNLPCVIAMKCHEDAIEKREASVQSAAKLLGSTKKILEKIQLCEVPTLDPDQMASIDEWRVHLKQSFL